MFIEIGINVAAYPNCKSLLRVKFIIRVNSISKDAWAIFLCSYDRKDS